MPEVLTRFAPSPTGALHLGHAYSALTVWGVAAALGGTALLRIEDFDSQRCKPGYEADILNDLHWLGLNWPEPVRRTSDHLADYDRTLDRLAATGLIYPCSCSRKDIAGAGAEAGWDGLVYPGTCRHRPMTETRPGDALRLNLAAALDLIGAPPTFDEIGPLYAGEHRPEPDVLRRMIGDPVLKRRGTGDPAYHLVVTHDDAVQGITHVVRGADLWHATFLHVVIQTVSGWPVPTYHHHDLIRDADGKRLAKIDQSRALAAYREDGLTPQDIKDLIGL